MLFDIASQLTDIGKHRRELKRLCNAASLAFKRGVEEFGTEWLQKSLIVFLYYGTDLSEDEIRTLRRKDVSKDRQGRWHISSSLSRTTVSTEKGDLISKALQMFIPKGDPSSEELLFQDSDGEALDEYYLQKLVRQYSVEEASKNKYRNTAPFTGEFAVIPTPLRLKADPRFTGRGVTIAFIDSGFYPHPDLVEPRNRILSYVNITNPSAGWDELQESDIASWHGMQTSVSACGNGYLSQGLYRGIASEANLVLIRLDGSAQPFEEWLVRAIEWVISHHRQFDIRVLNISLGAEPGVDASRVDQAVAEAVASGITVIVAAGNDPHKTIGVPGASEAAITVGGVDDKNVPRQRALRMYHSSHGAHKTSLVKPEIVAPAIWVAAPLLPGSQLYDQSLVLHQILRLKKSAARRLWRQKRFLFTDLASRIPAAPSDNIPIERVQVWAKTFLKKEKVIATHYQHVDGTSFAAPITASVVAQMLEADSSLTPEDIKKILIATAQPLKDVSPSIQGFGVVSPLTAVKAAQTKTIAMEEIHSPNPRIFKNVVTFRYHDPHAKSVALAGDFNYWDANAMPMKRQNNGVWTLTHEFPLAGEYRYKFVVNREKWIHDPQNTRRESDGFDGWNSLFFIHTPGNAEQIFQQFRKSLRTIDASDVVSRETAFRNLDSVLQAPMANRSYRVRQFYCECMERLVADLPKPVNHGELRVHQAYNMGVIIRAADVAVGCDLVTTRHVYNLFWNVDQTLVESIADSLDVLLITHRHPDHLDLELVNRLVDKGKVVIVPEELKGIMPLGSIGLDSRESRTVLLPGKIEGSLTLTAFQGYHVYDGGRNVPLCYYKVVLPTGESLLFLGDHDYTHHLEDDLNPHICFAKFGGVHPHRNEEEALQILETALFKEENNHGVIYLQHLNELGHPIKGGRISYSDAFAAVRRNPSRRRVLAWGESQEYNPFSDQGIEAHD